MKYKERTTKTTNNRNKGERMNIASDPGGYDFAVGGDGPLWADVGRRRPSALAQLWAPKTS